jgi:predicted RNase H-like HicB family nuclease
MTGEERGRSYKEQGPEGTSGTPAWTVILHEEPEEDGGGFWAEIPEMPGYYGSGDSFDQLRADLEDAIESHIAALQEVGLPVPPLFLVPFPVFPREGV